MLVYYIGESMVPIINIDYYGIKELTRGYQNCDYNQILICSVYVKVREWLCTQVIIWIDTILKHIDTREIVPGCERLLHGISRTSIYFDLCMNSAQSQLPILRTLDRKTIHIWWLANVEHNTFEVMVVAFDVVIWCFCPHECTSLLILDKWFVQMYVNSSYI